MRVNLKEVQDSARRFSESVKQIQKFIHSDTKHLAYILDEDKENIKGINYTLLSSDGVLVGCKKEKDYECVVPWDTFIDYVYNIKEEGNE